MEPVCAWRDILLGQEASQGLPSGILEQGHNEDEEMHGGDEHEASRAEQAAAEEAVAQEAERTSIEEGVLGVQMKEEPLDVVDGAPPKSSNENSEGAVTGEEPSCAAALASAAQPVVLDE